ncbi:aminotransferase class IV [Algihabitans albus]|uniref:aminotransferase class IV n=1 Tax=Algihabitans albus TaxID=2164067 RepID=UPI0013C34DF4|nr:aminotransferase class IV [Algihabitans albus]
MPDSQPHPPLAGPETQFPPGVAWIDGRFVPMSEAKIPILDWGFLRSDATYDVVSVWKNHFFRLDKHLDRFLASVAKLRMSLPFDRTGLETLLHETVTRSGLEDAYVEMICTRGHSPTFSRDPRDAVNRFIAFAIPFGWIADETQRDRGLRMIVASVPRIPAASVDPTIKNYHWLDMVRGLYEAYDRGGENVLLKDLDGFLTEGPGFNLFAVKDGSVHTPDRGVLEGITRGTALELCAELKIPTRIEPLSMETLTTAEEAFVTSTAGGIMAIASVDGQALPASPGPITRRLGELYWAKHQDPAWTTPVRSL